MINTIILERHPNSDQALQETIAESSPQLKLTREIFTPESFEKIVLRNNFQLIFLEIEGQFSDFQEILTRLKFSTFETILIASERDHLFEAIHYKICGYLLKPLKAQSLKNTVEIAINRIEEKAQKNSKAFSLSTDDILGIPTIEGYEFIQVQEIIRCESYLKCTRIVTETRSNIISAYNIGEFSKALDNYCFFSPHQSHLINLSKVKRYLKEGTIIMQDGACIPVARRRKNEFLHQIAYIIGKS